MKLCTTPHPATPWTAWPVGNRPTGNLSIRKLNRVASKQLDSGLYVAHPCLPCRIGFCSRLPQLEEIFKSFRDIDQSRRVPLLLLCPVRRDCLKAVASLFHLMLHPVFWQLDTATSESWSLNFAEGLTSCPEISSENFCGAFSHVFLTALPKLRLSGNYL